jgi:hypothetical protein
MNNLHTFPIEQKAQRAGGVAQEVDCLYSKHEALSLNPSTEKKKKVSLLHYGLNTV